MPKIQVSAEPCSLRALEEGPALPLPASHGSRHPWTCGITAPVSASIFTWKPSLGVCVCQFSPLLRTPTMLNWTHFSRV